MPTFGNMKFDWERLDLKYECLYGERALEMARKSLTHVPANKQSEKQRKALEEAIARLEAKR